MRCLEFSQQKRIIKIYQMRTYSAQLDEELVNRAFQRMAIFYLNIARNETKAKYLEVKQN